MEEFPIFENGYQEVVSAQSKEIHNHEDYKNFEKIDYEGQESIETGGVVMTIVKQNGQKMKIKARLVIQEF